MVEHLKREDVYFDFKVQLQTDPQTMPIEDATIEWNEAESGFIKVATIRIPVQEFDIQQRREFDENLSFNPWHTLPEHQPLGGVNRVRKQIYEAISAIRHQLNEQLMKEPTEHDYCRN